MRGPARFLIVDDDELMVRSLTRQLARFGGIHASSSFAEASQAVSNEPWNGFIVDYRLPDGTGLELLHRLQELQRPSDSVWLTTAYADDTLPRRVQALGFGFVEKPFPKPQLELWALRRIAARHLAPRGSALVAELAQRHRLSPMQTRVVALEAAAIPRMDWPDILGSKSTSINTHIQRVLKTSGARSLDALVQPVIHEVMTCRE